MTKVPWKKLDVWYVEGATTDEAARVVEEHVKIGDEIKSRIHQAENGVLVQVRDTDPDAEKAVGCLIAKFGQDRVIDASHGRHNF